MIEVNNISKTFRLSKKQMALDGTKNKLKLAVDNVSFKAVPGEIYGLLGPNGAGKTTTLRCISTLIEADEGTILVDGSDVKKDSREVRRKLCLLTNELKVDPNFTADYLFMFFGRLHGMDDDAISRRRETLFNEFGINEFAGVKTSDMSSGMKQKLSIAISLVHDPQVVIFDEPTNGLDIITARAVTDYLKKLRDEGKTVVISTHIMTVAEKLCDRIGLIIEGRIAAEGTLEYLLDETKAADLDDAFFEFYKRSREARDEE
ncbi:MAG: ATP-binding cassette domain-containing protein [Clostridia bacterium]|nr:ATP-binding cassette domain-containing protein [Clostridia bacterium]